MTPAADRGVPGGPARVEGCAFCTPSVHPVPLDETEHLMLLPDLYPLVPGHLLVVTQAHHLCLGATGPEVLGELPALAADAAAFLRASYGIEPLLWENGVTGQTVFHAHLHLIPINVDDLLDELVADPGSVEIGGWDDVAERYRTAGEYHYIHVRERSWLVEGNGAMNWEGRRRLAIASGIRRVDGVWKRPTRHEDVVEAADRWRVWIAHGRPAVSPDARGGG